MRLLIIGAGKLGKNFQAALKDATASSRGSFEVRLRADRKGLPRSSDAEVILLAVRDGRISSLGVELANARWATRLSAVVHASGALSPDALAPLREVGVPVAQLHPMLSFSSSRKPLRLGHVAGRRFAGGHALIAGDPKAVRIASRLAREVGLAPRHWEGIDLRLYHAAAALVANGAAALASVGAEVLVAAGVDAAHAPRVLGPLLASVAQNVEQFGLPDALTGPVRRGGTAVIRSHLAGLSAGHLASATELYRALVLAQLPLARELGDASMSDLEEIERLLAPERGARAPAAPAAAVSAAARDPDVASPRVGHRTRRGRGVGSRTKG